MERGRADRKQARIITDHHDRAQDRPALYTRDAYPRGYLLSFCWLFDIFSGGEGKRERAGVGFIVAPWLVKSIIGFHCHSHRLASLRLKVVGGSAGFISAYAPHSGYCFNSTQRFFQDLSSYVQRINCYGPRLVYGDLNTRLNLSHLGRKEYWAQMCLRITLP